VLSFPEGGGITLTAPASSAVALVQTVTVTAGKDYILEARAYPQGPPSPEENPSVELRWLGAEGTRLEVDPRRAEITQTDFDLLLLSGVVPEGAASVELAFIQPAEGALHIDRAYFSQPIPVVIPLTFVSEAAGQLDVIAPVVAYDPGGHPGGHPGGRPEARPPSGVPGGPAPAPEASTPEAPIDCAPTPPDDFPPPPGGVPSPEGGPYPERPPVGRCPCCETYHTVEKPHAARTQTGMRVVTGYCPNCRATTVVYPGRGPE
jgi:hypothetical protein